VSEPIFSTPLLTVLGPLSCEQVTAIAEMYPDAYIQQASAVTVDNKARAVFEIVKRVAVVRPAVTIKLKCEEVQP
jgi:hypothetical protein